MPGLAGRAAAYELLENSAAAAADLQRILDLGQPDDPRRAGIQAKVDRLRAIARDAGAGGGDPTPEAR